MDIASIVLSSTPRPKAVHASDDRRGPIFSGVTPPTEPPDGCSGCDFNASKIAIEGHVGDHSKPDTLYNEHHQQNDEPTRSLPSDGDDMALALREQKRAMTGPVETGRGWQAASHRAITDDAEGERRVDGTPRSLMGKMLGSGMLERQTEWSKERRRKVIIQRRIVAIDFMSCLIARGLIITREGSHHLGRLVLRIGLRCSGSAVVHPVLE